MKAQRHHLTMVAVFATVALCTSVSAAQEPLHARVSFESGGAMVKGTADSDWSYATINTIVLPGDTLWADEQSMLELEMSGGSFLRMADDSKAQVVQVPPSATIQAWTGSFYVHRIRRSNGDFIVQTPACVVDVDRESQVRIDVVDQGATTVSVHWGKASVSTDLGPAVTVTSGRRAFVDPGLLPSTPIAFDASVEDPFDSWSRERAELLAVGTRTIPLPVPADSVPIGVEDLSMYGDWVYVDSQPYWCPTYVNNYIPYRSGHWSYVPACGYAWVGDYPFSYVTCHYGRWTYNPHYGYLWSYSDTWGPAWVTSVRCGPDFVWCPLDPYDRPLTVGTGFFDVGGVRISIGVSSYCRADDLLYGPCGVYACTNDVFAHVNTGDVYIWNIYAPEYRHHPPFVGSSALVRDYAPRRVIRGPDIAGPSRHSAKDRVPVLEARVGRDSFRTVQVTGERNVRTASLDSTRMAKPRAVRVDPQVAANQATEIRRLEQHTNAPAITTGPNAPHPSRASASETGNRRAAVGEGRTSRGAESTRERSQVHANRTESLSRSQTGDSTATTEKGPRMMRTEPQVEVKAPRSGRSDMTYTPTTPRTSSAHSMRTPATTRSREETLSMPMTTPPQVTSPTTPPTRTSTPATTRRSSEVNRMSPSVSEPSRTMSRAETPRRVEVPRMSAPNDESPRMTTTAPRSTSRMSTTSPMSTTPRMSTTSPMSSTAPMRSEVRTTAPREVRVPASTPSMSQPRSATTNMRSMEVPRSPSVTAPSGRTWASTRSPAMSSPEPMRSATPGIRSVPEVRSAPSISHQRSYSAPSARSYSGSSPGHSSHVQSSNASRGRR